MINQGNAITQKKHLQCMLSNPNAEILKKIRLLNRFTEPTSDEGMDEPSE